MQNVHLSPPKKPHRRRRSVPALRLSPDTSPTLPAYHQTLHTHGEGEDPIPSDKPPDYPDSADEADEETELDNDDPFGPRSSHYKPPFATPPLTASPRRKRFTQQQQAAARPGRHKRNTSAVPVLKSRTDSSDVDTYLDSLLERSTRALEMSNALLESSISTQNTMSSFLTSSDYYSAHAESALEARAIGLSSKLLRNWDVQENWAQELSRIKQDVDSLFDDDDNNSRSRRHSRESTGSVSQSVPSTSPLTASPRKRPSVDYLQVHQQSSQLRYAPQDRATLISPPPRALTLYVDAGPSGSVSGQQTPVSSHTDLPAGFMLPATLGARPSQPIFHRAADNSYTQTASTSAASSPSSSIRRPFLPPLEPQLTNKPVDASTPAYNMLSSLVARSTNSSVANLGASASSSTLNLSLPPSTRPSIRDGKQREINDTDDTASAPSSFVSSFLSSMTTLARRNSSPSQRPLPGGSNSNSPSMASRSSRPTTTQSASTSRHHSPVVRKRSSSADQHSLASSRSSRSSRRGGIHNQQSTNESPVIQVRQMTPPTEGTDEDAEGESSSSSDGVVAKQTVLSLRKILDEQPPPVPPSPATESSKGGEDEDANLAQPQARKPRAPAFMPRTPTGTASAGTSTATASISRLFTKGVHSSSTRPRSPPLRSVMKRRLEAGSTGEGYSASVPVSPSHSVSSFTAGTMTPPSSASAAQQVTPSLAGAGTSSVPVGSAEAGLGGEGSPVGRLGHIAGLGMLVSRAMSASTLQLPQSGGANGGLSAGSSAPSSGRSTPKRISFAQLPESYASTKPEGEAGSVERRKNSRKKSKSSSNGLSRKRSSSDPASREDGNGSWWASWLGAADLASSGHGYSARDRERMEDRTTRRMTMGMGGGGHLGALDEWGV